MSVTESIISEREGSVLKTDKGDRLLSLNELFKASLRKIQADKGDEQIILRCELLPSIEGSHGEIEKLFDIMVGMIVGHSPSSSKLFLYIDCTDKGNLPDQDGFKTYEMRFYTNISTDEHWKVVNSQSIINCRHILSKHNGTLLVNHIISTGCLFVMTIAGKFV
jgi:hypothetical protein